MDDRVQRFLSKKDWVSLLQPRPERTKPLFMTRPSIRKVHFEEDDQQSPSFLQLQQEENDAKARAARELQRQRYETLQKRIQALSQPKKVGSETEEETDVGPANYDTRLDLSRPCFVSTRPNFPTAVIRKPSISKRNTATPNRLETTTTYSDATTVKVQERSVSVSRLGKKNKEETCRRKGSLGRESEGRALDLFGCTHLPDLRNYTPTPLGSQKGKYSIPKSNKKFSIKKRNFQTVSQLSQHFNSLFL